MQHDKRVTMLASSLNKTASGGNAEHTVTPVIDGVTAQHIYRPSTVKMVSDALAESTDSSYTIVPVGGLNHLETGNRLISQRWAALSTSQLNRVVEYSPEDMVVTVQAGVTLAQLQAELAKNNQMLPIDSPNPYTTTIGGIVATNAQGLWQHAYRLPRDLVLGLSIITANGEQIKAGGKVVKNVAGYDLCKLFCGSWGSLGFIAEATFKVRPLPECRAHIAFSAPSVSAAIQAGLDVHGKLLEPVYLVTASDPEPALYVGLHGHEKTVAWQIDEISRIVESLGLSPTDTALSEDGLRHAIVATSSKVVVRISAKPTDLPRCAESVSELGGQAVYNVQTGIVEAAFDGVAEKMPQFTALLKDILPSNARIFWKRVPPSWKATMDIWAPRPGNAELMRSIKSAIDPRGLFSAGRFAGRI